MNLAVRCLPLLSAAALLAGCGAKAPEHAGNVKHDVIVAEARMVMPIVSGTPAAAYFTIRNGGDAPVRIMTIDVRGAQMAMMHDTVDSGGVTRMDMLADLVVPAHGEVAFTPGAKHVMVTGLGPEIKPNTMSRITFTFDDGDKVSEDLPVVPPAVGAGN